MPANSAPATNADAADDEREHDRQPGEHREALRAGRSSRTYCARNAPREAGHAGREREHRELGLEHVDADRHRRGFAVAQRDQAPAERRCAGARRCRSRTMPNTTVTRSRNAFGRREVDAEQRAGARRGGSACRARTVCVKKTYSTSDANASVASARYRPWSRIAGSASRRADRHAHERREEHRAAAAVGAAEARVRDRADARERERRERDLPGPADERHERQRDERGAHAEREAVEVRRTERNVAQRRP